MNLRESFDIAKKDEMEKLTMPIIHKDRIVFDRQRQDFCKRCGQEFANCSCSIAALLAPKPAKGWPNDAPQEAEYF